MSHARRTRRIAGLLVFGCVAALLTAGGARAAGRPVLGYLVGPGVTRLDSGQRYMTRPDGRRTILQTLTASGAAIKRTILPGTYTIPVVAYDGSAAGASADGGTLALIRPRFTFPQRRTQLVIMDARTLQPRRVVRLSGDFWFDAISPDGHWIYLVQYTARDDPTRYRVRALSAASGRLLAGTIVDPRDRGEAMRGSPITRVASADGRWAYTLYDGNGHPFVHALDTVKKTARCIDVPPFAQTLDWSAIRLRLSGHTLTMNVGVWTLGQVETTTLALDGAPAPKFGAVVGRAQHDRSARSRVAGIAFPLVLAALLLGASLRFARSRQGARRPHPGWVVSTTPSREDARHDHRGSEPGGAVDKPAAHHQR